MLQMIPIGRRRRQTAKGNLTPSPRLRCWTRWPGLSLCRVIMTIGRFPTSDFPVRCARLGRTIHYSLFRNF